MRAFLRDNVAILIGVSLPIVVVAFFVLASYAPRAYLEPPQHDAVLVSYSGGNVRPVRVEVDVNGGRLRTRVYKLDYNGNAIVYGPNAPRLFLWSHETRSVREIPIDVPADLDGFVNGGEVQIPELAGLRLSTEQRAPDGYMLSSTGYRSGPFGLFFDRSSPRLVLEKDGAVHAVPLPASVPYWDVRFLAWVVE